jgi:preprotein translocase subunit SecF
MLLTIRVLKRKDDGPLNERIYGAMKTGGLMTFTALASVSAVLIFSNSSVLLQIMLILFIGLCIDLITTWIQNVCMLRWYMIKKMDDAHE